MVLSSPPPVSPLYPTGKLHNQNLISSFQITESIPNAYLLKILQGQVHCSTSLSQVNILNINLITIISLQITYTYIFKGLIGVTDFRHTIRGAAYQCNVISRGIKKVQSEFSYAQGTRRGTNILEMVEYPHKHQFSMWMNQLLNFSFDNQY